LLPQIEVFNDANIDEIDKLALLVALGVSTGVSVMAIDGAA
jgi:hypothetical protein